MCLQTAGLIGKKLEERAKDVARDADRLTGFSDFQHLSPGG